jgi:hypothetical protein
MLRLWHRWLLLWLLLHDHAVLRHVALLLPPATV